MFPFFSSFRFHFNSFRFHVNHVAKVEQKSLEFDQMICSMFFFIEDSVNVLLPNSSETTVVGGLNPFEKYYSNWIISPIFGVKIQKMFELPPPRKVLTEHQLKT